MGNITTAMVFVWTLNILMFLTQAAMIDIGPSTGYITVYNCSGTIMESYASGGCTEIMMPNTNDISNELPVSVKDVNEGGNYGFLDTIATAKNWITDKINYIAAIVSAPYTIISNIPGIPQVFKATIGILWYAISIFLFVAWILGKET